MRNGLTWFWGGGTQAGSAEFLETRMFFISFASFKDVSGNIFPVENCSILSVSNRHETELTKSWYSMDVRAMEKERGFIFFPLEVLNFVPSNISWEFQFCCQSKTCWADLKIGIYY